MSLHPSGSVARAAIAVLAIAAMACPAGAEPAPPAPGLAADGTGRVATIVDADTLTLADGREVRLVGIQGPRLSLGRANVKDWPQAEAARAALVGLVEGREVALWVGGAPQDRRGRRLAHATTPDGTWVQGALLEAGWARVYLFPDNRAAAAEMLAREAAARTAKRGIWADPFYAVRTPETVAGGVGGYQLVEGTVAAAAVAGGRGYLNFGPDRRTDFTVVLAPAVVRALADGGRPVASLAGAEVRVRGWVGKRDGPEIRLDVPEALEIVGGPLLLGAPVP